MSYADLRTDFVFQKVFGQHEDVLRGLLNDLLEREGDRAITSLQYLPPGQPALAPGAKLSILDVRCRTERGEVFVVEMQVLPVTGFLNRVVFNACKAYVGTLPEARPYDALVDVVAVSICDFVLWGDAEQDAKKEPRVPLLSRWKMRERAGAEGGLGQIQYVFLELPKLGDRAPQGAVEWWASLFRVAPELRREEVAATTEITDAQRKALSFAEMSQWSAEDVDAYLRAREEVDQVVRMVETGLAKGRAEGRAAGRAEGRTEGERSLLERLLTARLGRALTDDERTRLHAAIDTEGVDAVMMRVAAGDLLGLA